MRIIAFTDQKYGSTKFFSSHFKQEYQNVVYKKVISGHTLSRPHVVSPLDWAFMTWLVDTNINIADSEQSSHNPDGRRQT